MLCKKSSDIKLMRFLLTAVALYNKLMPKWNVFTVLLSSKRPFTAEQRYVAEREVRFR